MACAARSTIAAAAASVGCSGRLCQHKRRAQRQCGEHARRESRFEHFDLLSGVARLLADIRIASVWMTSPKGELSHDRKIGSWVEDHKYDFNMQVSVEDIAGQDHSMRQCGVAGDAPETPSDRR
jgi:hypothetical protein